MTDRTRNSYADRKECFKLHKRADETWGWVMDCHICKGLIVLSRDEWEAEHVIPEFFKGTIVLPAHANPCHKAKTKVDKGDIAKSKRQEDRIYGVKRTAGTMPGSRGSPFKKKMNGTVERRS